MPRINRYKCSKCEFLFPGGWGGYFYLIDELGHRSILKHPGEWAVVRSVLGSNASPKLIKERTGFNSYCICLSCKHEFVLDIGSEKANEWRYYYRAAGRRRDKRQCPKCQSKKVKTVCELIGKPCPICKEGVIEKVFTGLIA